MLAVIGNVGARATVSSAQRSTAEALASLPVPAQAAISRVLGRDQRTYSATAANGALGFTNDAQRLSARFAASGVEVRSGQTLVRLSLRTIGDGSRLAPVAEAAPTALGNRISYRRGALTEWYLNGPLGIEQGFTLQRAPARRRGPLTLELELEVTGARPILQSRTRLSFTGSSLRYRGLFAADSRGKHLPAWLELRGRTLLIRVADAGARYPLTIDPFLQQAKLAGFDAARPGDELGYSVAVSGDTIVAGAPYGDASGTGDHGAVYVFVKPVGGWANGTETARLTAADGLAGDLLGSSVAVSGDTIVAGAPGADPGGSGERGAAYVFVSISGWTSTSSFAAKLSASDGAPGDRFGSSVAVSGDTIVAGAPSARDRGAVYVFEKPLAGWANGTETTRLTASDVADNDRFGSSVALSDGLLVAGAPGADLGGNDEGAAYVFVNQSGWVAANNKLISPGGGTGAQFGSSLALSGGLLVVGEPGVNSEQGAVYVIFLTPGGATFESPFELTASDGATDHRFGSSVAISGETVVVGAPGAVTGGNDEQGAAYVFVRPAAGPWVFDAKLTASDGLGGDLLGGSVAISGDTVLAAARSADVGGNANQGAAYVFESTGAGWPHAGEARRIRRS